MTSCPAGTERKPGTDDYIWWLLSGFRSFLLSSFSRIGAIFGIFLPDRVLTADELCASEVTVRTPPTILQWLGFVTRVWPDFYYVLGYLEELYLSSLWDTYCQCEAVASTCYFPCPTAAQPNSNALPANHRRGVEYYMKVSGLTVYGARVYFAAVGAGTFDVQWVDQHAGTNALQSFSGVTGVHDYLFTTPHALTNVNSSYIHDLILRFPNSGYDLTYNGVGETPIDTTQVHVNKLIYQADLTSGMIELFNQTLPISPIICDADPLGTPPPYTPVAPADPTDLPDNPLVACTTTDDLCAKIDDIQAWIQATRQDVNWLQSATAPTCWVPGTAHTGLTGAGTIDVADVVGAYVTVTVPASWGRTAETPPRYIPKVGEIQFAIDDVVADGRQLHYSEEQLLGCPTATNSIVYNIRGGVTASITPLERCK
jgi:hypothetical protein